MDDPTKLSLLISLFHFLLLLKLQSCIAVLSVFEQLEKVTDLLPLIFLK